MYRTIITITILILGLAFGVQDDRNIVGQSFSLATDLTIPKNMNFQGTLYQDGSPVTDTLGAYLRARLPARFRACLPVNLRTSIGACLSTSLGADLGTNLPGDLPSHLLGDTPP